jgi:hypothetical protein
MWKNLFILIVAGGVSLSITIGVIKLKYKIVQKTLRKEKK